MSLILRFTKLHAYDASAVGITAPVSLRSGPDEVKLPAKVDTGSSHCVFERQYGEQLGLDIESGSPERFGTATGSFPAYGHEVTLSVLGIEMVSTVYFAAAEGFSRNVLARIGWLDRLRFGLVGYDNRLYLSDYNDPA
jgi:hypothetical protein